MKQRIIKYKVWDTTRKCHRDLSEDVGEYTGDVRQFCDTCTLDENGVLNWGKMCDGGYLIFRQFTGLLDKNGKEIYEGDIIELCGEAIVSHGKSRIVVEYDPRCAAYHPLYIYRSKDETKVIGNIYENPELIK